MELKCKKCSNKRVEKLYDKNGNLKGHLCKYCGFIHSNYQPKQFNPKSRPIFDGQQISKGKRR